MSAEESSASAEGVCDSTAGSLGLSTPPTRQKRKSIMHRSVSPASSSTPETQPRHRQRRQAAEESDKRHNFCLSLAEY
eukprot:1000674-Rhodomonas_salina.1